MKNRELPAALYIRLIGIEDERRSLLTEGRRVKTPPVDCVRAASERLKPFVDS